jgi:hypothetical protein
LAFLVYLIPFKVEREAPPPIKRLGVSLKNFIDLRKMVFSGENE